jgi:hypothetical protein
MRVFNNASLEGDSAFLCAFTLEKHEQKPTNLLRSLWLPPKRVDIQTLFRLFRAARSGLEWEGGA